MNEDCDVPPSSLKLQVYDMRKALDAKESEIFRLRSEIAALKEQLEIARTATSDTEEFRQRERKHAEAVMTGYSLAISAMVTAMKGGK